MPLFLTIFTRLLLVSVLGFAATASAQGTVERKGQFFRPLSLPAIAASAKAGNAAGVSTQALAVQLNTDELFGLGYLGEIQLTLPSGIAHTVVYELGQDHGGGISSWVGYVKGSGRENRVIFTTGPAGSYGVIDAPEGSYRIVPGGIHDWLVDMTHEQLYLPIKSLGNDAVMPAPRTKSVRTDPALAAFQTAIPGVNSVGLGKTTPSPQAVIDLMFVVTTGLANNLGANLATRLNFLVTRANTSYADSEVAITLRLVNTTTVNYTDANDDGTALDAISPGTSVFDSATFGNIETIRNSVGADMVALLRNGGNFSGGGVAWLGNNVPEADLMYAVATGCTAGCESVLIHELGHNMGNAHDRKTVAWQSGGTASFSEGAFSYSYGYVFCKSNALSCDPEKPPTGGGCSADVGPECSTSDPSNFRDLMAYFGGTARDTYRFSNPAINCVSSATGADAIPRPCGVSEASPTAANTALSMNNNRVAISALKATVVTTVTLTVTKSGTGAGTVTSSPAGINCGSTCAAEFLTTAPVTLTATATSGSVFGGWSGGGCSGTGTCVITLAAATTVTATFTTLAGTPTAVVSPTSRDFGGQSMRTTAPSQTVTLVNVGTGTLTVTSITSSTTQFAQTNNCTTVATGASCTVTLTFTPTVQGAVTGTLTLVTNGGTQTVALTGTGEKSLVTHYYRSILRRAPDAGGKTFWDAEAARVQALGVNVNEVWFAMAGSFYFSSEYVAFNRDDAGYVTDLYNTFFNRAPDAGGFADWQAQLAAGMPREVVLASFMFSAEFSSFTQAIFGTTTTRKEIDTVVDFYRGLLGSLPDDGGFNFWLGLFRAAQCQGGPAVNAQVESISSAFANSAQYLGRGRTNAQYVGDLYNAFLRRGAAGDLAGVQFWISQITTGARTRENVRQAFVGSAEFSARVAAVIAQGCLP